VFNRMKASRVKTAPTSSCSAALEAAYCPAAWENALRSLPAHVGGDAEPEGPGDNMLLACRSFALPDVASAQGQICFEQAGNISTTIDTIIVNITFYSPWGPHRP
jgi:hypothetical protein